jgi:sporulation protein YlmC with PRC-barrel domain
MRTLDEVQTWRGKTLVDADGDKVGKIDDVYLDRQTGEPEWMTVRTGLFGLKSSFVPIEGAEPADDDDKIRVPWQKEQIKDAPRVEEMGELSTDDERKLYEHYGRKDYGEWQGDDRTRDLDLPAETTAGRFSRGEGETSGAPDDAGAQGDADTPAVVGVRLRRVVVVAAEPITADDPGQNR